jgi:hypothetical protein
MWKRLVSRYAGGRKKISEICDPLAECLTAALGFGRGMAADHLLPVAEGGECNLDNLRTLCLVCHRQQILRLQQGLSPPETGSCPGIRVGKDPVSDMATLRDRSIGGRQWERSDNRKIVVT